MYFRLPETPFKSDWLVVVLTAAITTLYGYLLGFSLPRPQVFEAIGHMAACLLIASNIRAQQLFPKVCNFISMLAWIGLFTVAMSHAHYVLPATNLPLWDQSFASFDKFLGIDQVGLRETISNDQTLSTVLTVIYNNTCYQLYLALALLLVLRQYDRLADTLSVLTLGTAGTLIGMVFMPAVGPYEFHNFASLHPGHITAYETGAYVQTYLDLRSGVLREFPLKEWHGVATFPSFHFIYSLTAMYAVARIKYLAAPSIAFSALVGVSAVPVGGHYTMDLLGGLAVWAACIWFVERRRALLKAQPNYGNAGQQTVNPAPAFA